MKLSRFCLHRAISDNQKVFCNKSFLYTRVGKPICYMVPTVLVAPVPPGGLNEISTVPYVGVLNSSLVLSICMVLNVTQMIPIAS
jgi:hypothetical protein